MKSARFKFRKFTIDETWKSKFSSDALEYLSNSKEWLYDKISRSVNHNQPTDWIIIVDTGCIEESKDLAYNQKNIQVRTLLVSSDHDFYNGFDNMFFKFKADKRGAIMNLQSEYEAIKEIANAIVRENERAELDESILFPYTIDCWREKNTGGETI